MWRIRINATYKTGDKSVWNLWRIRANSSQAVKNTKCEY